MKKITTSAAFALFAVLGASPAQAAIYHTTTGVDCQSVYPDTYVYSQNVFHSNGVHAYDTVNPKFFQCSMQRDNGLSTTGLSSAYVDVYDASNGNMWCQLTATDEYGNSVASSGAKYSGGGAQREIAFGNIATSDAWGAYNMFCTMAPTVTAYNSYIYTYQWVER
jgi:hypothetical protein